MAMFPSTRRSETPRFPLPVHQLQALRSILRHHTMTIAMDRHLQSELIPLTTCIVSNRSLDARTSSKFFSPLLCRQCVQHQSSSPRSIRRALCRKGRHAAKASPLLHTTQATTTPPHWLAARLVSSFGPTCRSRNATMPLRLELLLGTRFLFFLSRPFDTYKTRGLELC